MKEKRKTYSLDPERSRQLARCAIDIGGETGMSVSRQGILDSLVECLSDKTVLVKVVKIIKRDHGKRGSNQ